MKPYRVYFFCLHKKAFIFYWPYQILKANTLYMTIHADINLSIDTIVLAYAQITTHGKPKRNISLTKQYTNICLATYVVECYVWEIS